MPIGIDLIWDLERNINIYKKLLAGEKIICYNKNNKTKERVKWYEKYNRWKPCGSTHTHTHTIMSTKRSAQNVNKLVTKDVKTTSLKIMYKKARKQYLVFKKLKLDGL